MQPAKYIDKIIAAPAEETIAFDDYDRRRRLIFDSVQESVRQRFPLSNERYSLEIEDVGYDDADKPFSLKEQKGAILKGGTLTKKLKGRFVLKDAVTGQVLQKGGRRVLANVPYLTQRGTFIRNGNESVLVNQMRMIPGAYARTTDDGLKEALVNVRQGTGTQFKLKFDPAEARFDIHAGGRKFPAYSLLKEIGVPDDDLKKAWGEDIFNKNRALDAKRAVNSAVHVFVPNYKSAPSVEEGQQTEHEHDEQDS